MRLARFVWFVIQHKLLLKQNRVNHHPFYLIGYSISFEKINKKWNGRLRTSLRAAAFKEALSTYFTAFPLRKQSFDLKNLRFGPISFLFIHLMIIRCRGFVKRVVVVLFSFPALSVRHLVTHLRACAAYKLVRFTAGVRAYAWALLLSNAWGCQVVSPHCLVAPGYVAPTEVTSPQHRSCVAPTSWLCRPNIKVASPQRVTSLIK